MKFDELEGTNVTATFLDGKFLITQLHNQIDEMPNNEIRSQPSRTEVTYNALGDSGITYMLANNV